MSEIGRERETERESVRKIKCTINDTEFLHHKPTGIGWRG